MNRGCPLLHVVPRRFLLGIEHAIRPSTGDKYLKVWAVGFEGKPVMMSPWIKHGVRIEVFCLHRLTESRVIANILAGLGGIFIRDLVDNLARLPEVLPLHRSRLGIIRSLCLFIWTITLKCQYVFCSADGVLSLVSKPPWVNNLCEIDTLGR